MNCCGCGFLNMRGFCNLTACINPLGTMRTEKKTAICPSCGRAVEEFVMFNGNVVGCKYCVAQKKTETNADRIRSTSDEELAEWLVAIQNDVADYYDGGRAFEPDFPTHKNAWLKWLKKERSEDG